jgi:hypothetical protein
LIPKSLFGHHPEEKKELAFLNWLNEDKKKKEVQRRINTDIIAGVVIIKVQKEGETI